MSEDEPKPQPGRRFVTLDEWDQSAWTEITSRADNCRVYVRLLPNLPPDDGYTYAKFGDTWRRVETPIDTKKA